jgi:hypothetical protein
MSEVMEPNLAFTTIRDYVCSECWQQLISISAEGHNLNVVCGTNPEHAGFVRRSGIERKANESHGELVEATMNLRGIIPMPKKSEKELLNELGF